MSRDKQDMFGILMTQKSQYEYIFSLWQSGFFFIRRGTIIY